MSKIIFDIAIIGAGVVGAAIARKLSSYNLEIALIEKECDVSFGVSKANSGIIHGGFHHGSEYLKSKLEVQGNRMFDQLEQELHFPFRRCGIIVAAFSIEEMKTVEQLYLNGIANKVVGIEMCNRSRMLSLEPKLNTDVVGGLYAPAGGIIEPYRFVFSLVESALKNGVKLFTEFKVVSAEHNSEGYTVISENGNIVHSKWAVNASGLFADEISNIFNAEKFKITPRKGEEFLLDRNSAARTEHVVFPVPDHVSKGILIIPTVEGTTMLGPTAIPQDSKEDVSTTSVNLGMVFSSARRMVPSISQRDIITSFTGLRPVLESGDFYIDISKKQKHFIQVAGIQSPGLTAVPAIAEYVKDLVKKDGLILTEKSSYDPDIEKLPRMRTLNPEEADVLIQDDPSFGEIVCRCESVSEAEIVAAVKHGHTTLDGIKFYTRAQMGRCQGGFCTDRIIKIVQRETGLRYEDITKRGKDSWLIEDRIGDIKVNSYGSVE
ncbi:MAG: NAD(P)/FAD-dependent oxidoreductase [Spirochaetia bacterium]|jgi:glycerol-3-phosphate dehydrogenase|nr:NAD(P)/FAD-dependent oxidoreductase [Spirochaetia bacterium]